MRALLGKFGGGRGRVDYAQFLELAGEDPSAHRGRDRDRDRRGGGGGGGGGTGLSATAGKVRERLLAWAEAEGSLRLVFEKMDADRSGAVERGELRRTLRTLKIKIEDEELDAVIDGRHPPRRIRQ